MLTNRSSCDDTDACGAETAYASVLPGVAGDASNEYRKVAEVLEGEWVGHVRRIQTDRD